MDYQIRKINHTLLVIWQLIVLILIVSYSIEILKGQRDLGYVITFSMFWFMPALICTLIYRKNNASTKLKYFIIYGYMISYAFTLFTAKTGLPFVYAFPLLSACILYHDPNLITHLGAVTIIINSIDIIQQYMSGELTAATSRNGEIQMACLILCFVGCYISAKLYDEMSRKSEENMKQIQDVSLQTIAVIANTVDAKDSNTEGHSRRVAAYSYAIAKKLGMSEKEAENIRTIGLLHDIGKIGIPDAVLHKPGKLTDDEYAIMKMHPTIGANILKDITVIDGVDVGAHFHHERYDGKGYPDGLKGEEIPYIARIIGVADSFDAMHSNRVYRSRFSMDYILNELKKGEGTQFDPQAAEAMISLIENNELQGIEECKTTTALDDLSSEKENDVINGKGVYLLDEISHKNQQNFSDFNRISTEDWANMFRKHVEDKLMNSDGLMFVIDVDDMHGINDKYGYGKGDMILKSIYNTLCRDSDIMATVRTGGDEFMCWVEKDVDQETYKAGLQELLDQIKSGVSTDTGVDDINLSIGATSSAVSGRDYEMLINDAHKSLYFVKKAGKNSFDIYNHERALKNVPMKAVEHDLNAIADLIANESEYNGAYHTDYGGFEKIYNLMRNVSNRYLENIQLVLFTISFDSRGGSITSRDVAMNILESAIVSTLRKTDVTARYSTTQQLLLLMNINDENMKLITDRIMREFYRMYDKGNVTLMTSTKNVSMAKFKYNPNNKTSS